MRIGWCSLVAVAAVLLVPALAGAQDASRAVAGGGIKAPGWSGVVDPASVKAGQGVSDSLLAPEGGGLHVTTGPAITYWQTGKSMSGNYTVSATFTEPKFMNLNTHPHPYGIVIAGNDMGTDQNTYLYCAAYGSGNFIVRGMGPAAFALNGRAGEANAAVHKAAGVGQPVTQDIAMTVKGDSVTCSINGTVVGTYTKTDLVTTGKLKATDGAYGIRFAHNTDAIVTNFKVTKN